jgi:hypothetical protein
MFKKIKDLISKYSVIIFSFVKKFIWVFISGGVIILFLTNSFDKVAYPYKKESIFVSDYKEYQGPVINFEINNIDQDDQKFDLDISMDFLYDQDDISECVSNIYFSLYPLTGKDLDLNTYPFFKFRENEIEIIDFHDTQGDYCDLHDYTSRETDKEIKDYLAAAAYDFGMSNGSYQISYKDLNSSLIRSNYDQFPFDQIYLSGIIKVYGNCTENNFERDSCNIEPFILITINSYDWKIKDGGIIYKDGIYYYQMILQRNIILRLFVPLIYLLFVIFIILLPTSKNDNTLIRNSISLVLGLYGITQSVTNQLGIQNNVINNFTFLLYLLILGNFIYGYFHIKRKR